MTNRFHLTKEVSVLPTILALLSLGLGGWQFYSQSNYNNESRLSYVGARVNQYHDSKVEIVPGPDNYDEYVYRKKAKITLSNNGFHPASIVDWSFYLPLDIDEKKAKTLKVWVPGIEPRLKSVDGNDFNLPINIEPGKSESFVLEYSVGISGSAYQQLPESYKNKNSVDWRSIESKLTSIYDEKHYTEYLLELDKSDGGRIEFRFTNFGTNGFMQGEKRPDMPEFVR